MHSATRPGSAALVKNKPKAYPYVVAEVGRSDAEVRLHYAARDPRSSAESVEEVKGSTEHLSKFPGGGWSQHRYQHRTEEIWRRNADEVAGAVDEAVSNSGARLIILAGDVHARGLVVDQLSKASQAMVEQVDSHTHTEGDNRQDLDEAVSSMVAARWAEDQQKILGAGRKDFPGTGCRTLDCHV